MTCPLSESAGMIYYSVSNICTTFRSDLVAFRRECKFQSAYAIAPVTFIVFVKIQRLNFSYILTTKCSLDS